MCEFVHDRQNCAITFSHIDHILFYIFLEATSRSPRLLFIVNKTLSRKHVNKPLSRKHVNKPLSRKHVNKPLSRKHVNKPLSRKHVNKPLSRKHVNHWDPASVFSKRSLVVI